MNALVISLGVVTTIIGFVIWCYQLMEYARKKTEKSIAVFYRDYPMQCTIMLNKIGLEETKKEIAKHKMTHEGDK